MACGITREQLFVWDSQNVLHFCSRVFLLVLCQISHGKPQSEANWCSSCEALGLNLSSACIPWAGNITLLPRNKTWDVVLGPSGRESWRRPPKGRLLSSRKEKVVLCNLHSDGAMLVHCTPRGLAVEYAPEIWAFWD